jgi:hypothetical protein
MPESAKKNTAGFGLESRLSKPMRNAKDFSISVKIENQRVRIIKLNNHRSSKGHFRPVQAECPREKLQKLSCHYLSSSIHT